MMRRGTLLLLLVIQFLSLRSSVVAEDPGTPAPSMVTTVVGDPVNITIVLTTDDAPQETGWFLFESLEGSILAQASAGTYTTPGAVVSATMTVAEGSEYTLQLTDTGSDGICCGNGIGNVIVYLGNGPDQDAILATSDGMFGAQEFLTFEASSEGSIVVMPSAAPSGPTDSPSFAPTTLMPSVTGAPTRLTFPVMITIAILTDDFPSETLWALFDSDSNLVSEFDNYTNEFSLELQTVVVNKGERYVLLLMDVASDGICCAYGNGEVRVYLGFPDTNPIGYSNGNFGQSTNITFAVSMEGVIDVPPPAPTFAPGMIFTPFPVGVFDDDDVSPPSLSFGGNDECANAAEIFPGDFVTGSTADATIDRVVDCLGEFPTAPGVWYMVRGTGGLMTASLCLGFGASTGGFDSRVSVFANECNDPICINEADDQCGGGQGYASWISDVDVPYYILVHGFSDNVGNFGITIGDEALSCNVCGPGATMGNPDGVFFFPGLEPELCVVLAELGEIGAIPTCSFLPALVSEACQCFGGAPSPIFFPPQVPVAPTVPPLNDFCENAEAVDIPATVSGTTIGSTIDPEEEQCFVTIQGGGVWYSVIGTGEFMRASTCDSSTTFDTQLSVYEGSCSRLRCLDGNDDDGACRNNASTIGWFGERGVEYKILVHGFAGATGDFVLDVGLSSSPVMFSPAQTPVFQPSFLIPFSICGGEGIVVTAPDTQYSFEFLQLPAFTCQLWQDLFDFGIFNPDFLTSSSIAEFREVCMCEPISPAVTATPTFAPAPLFNPVFNLPSFSLGDECSEAVPVELSLPNFGTTMFATVDNVQDCDGTLVTAPGVWHTVVGTGLDMTASLCLFFGTSSGGYDSKLSVFGGDCTTPLCLGSADNTCGEGQGFVTWFGELGVEYHLLVHGVDDSSGPYSLLVGDTSFGCNICGEGGEVGNPTEVVSSFPGVTFAMECGILAELGQLGVVPGPTCGEVFQAVNEPCQCSGGDAFPTFSPVFFPTFTLPTLPVAPAFRPFNDVCENAEEVLEVPSFVFGTTVGAAPPTVVEEQCFNLIASGGAWYTVIGTGERLRANTCSLDTNYDTQLNVFEGSCSSLICLDGNDDRCGLGSAVEWDSVDGVQYTILVHGFGVDTGDFGLEIGLTSSPVAFPISAPFAFQPASPFAAPVFSPTNLLPCAVCGEGFVVGAPDEILVVRGQPSFTCQLFQDIGDFGFWNPEACFDIQNSDIQDVCQCQPFSPAFTRSPSQAPVLPPSFAPAVAVDNDSCDTAILANFGELAGTTSGAAIDNAPFCVESITSPGVWYTFVGTGEVVTMSLCADVVTAMDYDTKLSIYSGSCSNLECVDANDDFCDTQSSVTALTEDGVTYFILVHGFGGDVGEFTLSISAGGGIPPIGAPSQFPIAIAPVAAPSIAPVISVPTGESESSHDICSNAIPIDMGFVIGTTTGATQETDTERCGTSITSPGVWYTIIGTGERMSADTCNDTSDYDTKISIYEGTSCSSMACIAGNDDGGRCTAARSFVAWDSTAGATYQVLVHGFGGASGSFGLNITEIPP